MSIQDLFKANSVLVPGTLRGYRTWRWIPGFDRLFSTGMSTHRWAPPPLPEEARCFTYPYYPTDHVTPSTDCACGIYGWYQPDDTRIVPASVFGVIAASGRIVMGTHGFRAAAAQVLAVTTEDHEIRDALRRLGYQVFDDRDELLAAYPPEDVSALVDHHCDGTCAKRASNLSLHLQHVHVALQNLGAAAFAASAAMSRVFVAPPRASPHARGLAFDVPLGTAPDPRQFALEARRNRNTGPKARRTPPPRKLP